MKLKVGRFLAEHNDIYKWAVHIYRTSCPRMEWASTGQEPGQVNVLNTGPHIWLPPALSCFKTLCVVHDSTGRGQLEAASCTHFPWLILICTFVVTSNNYQQNCFQGVLSVLQWIIEPEVILGTSDLKSVSEMRVVLGTHKLCSRPFRYFHSLWHMYHSM